MSIQRSWVSLAPLWMMAMASAHAQSPSLICGTVTGASGARIVGVTVTLAGTPATISSGVGGKTSSATATTDGKGGYIFPSVPVGAYSLSFELPGLMTKNVPQVVIRDGFGQRIDVQLTEASMSPSRGTFTREQDTVSIVPFAVGSAVSPPSCGASR